MPAIMFSINLLKFFAENRVPGRDGKKADNRGDEKNVSHKGLVLLGSRLPINFHQGGHASPVSVANQSTHLQRQLRCITRRGLINFVPVFIKNPSKWLHIACYNWRAFYIARPREKSAPTGRDFFCAF